MKDVQAGRASNCGTRGLCVAPPTHLPPVCATVLSLVIATLLVLLGRLLVLVSLAAPAAHRLP